MLIKQSNKSFVKAKISFFEIFTEGITEVEENFYPKKILEYGTILMYKFYIILVSTSKLIQL